MIEQFEFDAYIEQKRKTAPQDDITFNGLSKVFNGNSYSISKAQEIGLLLGIDPTYVMGLVILGAEQGYGVAKIECEQLKKSTTK